MSSRRPIALLSNERGAAIIELAIVAPVLALGVIGIVDMSNAYSRKLALEQGAQRAIEKIMQTTQETTVESTLATEAVCQVDGMNSDGTCKTSPITSSNVTVSWRRECSTSAGALTTTAAGNSTPKTYTTSAAYDADPCAGGAKEADYIQVALTDKYTPMFPVHFASYSSTDGAYDISATAGVRIK
jgi:Flp pilus assembly protein TadG